MDNKITFFKINSQDNSYEDYKNVSAQSIISYKKDDNNFSTKVFVKELGWIVLDIGYEDFTKLINLHR